MRTGRGMVGDRLEAGRVTVCVGGEDWKGQT